MKVLVSYMHRGTNLFETTYGHMTLEMSYWDTKAVTEKIGEVVEKAPEQVIITGVFQIPESRFSKEEKAYLKDWMQLAYEHIESDDDVQHEVIQNLIKELNE